MAARPRSGDHPAPKDGGAADARSQDVQGGERGAKYILPRSGVGEGVISALVDGLAPCQALDQREDHDKGHGDHEDDGFRSHALIVSPNWRPPEGEAIRRDRAPRWRGPGTGYRKSRPVYPTDPDQTAW